MANAFRGLTRSYVNLAVRRPWLLLAIFTVVTIGAGYFASKNRVDTNLERLLPDDMPSRLALDQSRIRRGSTELYTIAVESPNAYANIAVINEMAAVIEAEWPHVVWVQVDEDPEFFQDNLLLYLPEQRLERFRGELRNALECELTRNPAYVSLLDVDCDANDVEWTFDYWIGDGLEREIGLPQGFFGDMNLGEGFEGDDDEPDTASDDPTPPEGTGTALASPDETPEGTGAGVSADVSIRGFALEETGLPDDLKRYIISGNGQIAVLYVQLDSPSTDVSFASEMRQLGQDLLARMQMADYHPEMRAEVVGAYRAMDEAREAVSDSTQALYASLILVVLVMMIFFRAIRGLIIVIIPLLYGIAWSLGVAYFAIGELNLFSLFVGSVLVGMGIDFGIHLYGRALEEFRGGASWVEGLEASLYHTGLALGASAITTIGALATLLASEFRGFKEFGLIASIGIFLCMMSAYLVIPPLVIAFERIRKLKRPKAASDATQVAKRFRLSGTATILASLAVLAYAALQPWARIDAENTIGPILGTVTDPSLLRYALPTVLGALVFLIGKSSRFHSLVAAAMGLLGIVLWQVFMLELANTGLDATTANLQAGTGVWLLLTASGLVTMGGLIGVLIPGTKPSQKGISSKGALLALSGAALVVLLVNMVIAPKVGFEYDFRNLRGPSSRAGISYGAAVGRGKNTAPSILLGQSPSQMREVHELLAERYRDDDPMLKGFITIETFVPQAQEERLAIIWGNDPDDFPDRRTIAHTLNRRAMRRLRGPAADFVDHLRELVEVRPFTVDDIPGWAIRSLSEAEDSEYELGSMGLMYRRVQTWNALEVRKFQDRFQTLEVASGSVHVADGSFITADVISTVQNDGKRMGLYVVIILIVVLLATLRSIRGTIICMLTMGAAFLLCLGVMVVTNTKIGMYNMIVVPAILGVAIDGAIHIYHRFRESGGHDISGTLRTTGLAVAAASLTTAGGFGGLLIQRHMGITSIGTLSVIGILSALVAIFFLMPGLLALFGPKDKKPDEGEGAGA